METVDHPEHYNNHPTGVECIDIIEHFTFNLGAAIKYIWRSGLKGERVEDLRKALWYIQREIDRLNGEPTGLGEVPGIWTAQVRDYVFGGKENEKIL